MAASGALAGAAALPRPGLAQRSGDRDPGAAASSTEVELFADPGLDFNARFALGAAGYGCSEVGEVIAAIDRANAAGGTIASFVDTFAALAERTQALAEDARARGRLVTARAAYLRAAEYHAQVLFFVLGSSDPASEPAVYARVRSNWEAYAGLAEMSIQKVFIPYEDTTIPGYLLRPDDSGRARATVIVNNGSDAQTVETFAYGGAAAVARGYNALLFEGPGQGAMLFEREIPFRFDWENVIRPIVDWLGRRRDVDASRIALTGWSLGGELVIRAAAFEHRLAAVVADPGAVDMWQAWPSSIRDIARAGDAATQNRIWQQDVIPGLSAEQAFDIRKRAEIFARSFLVQARAGEVPTDYALLAASIQRFNCVDVARSVTAPVLVTGYEREQFVPGQAQQLHDLLRSPKDLVTFTVAEGADYHCAPMAPQYRNEVVFDWLDDVLGGGTIAIRRRRRLPTVVSR